MILRKKDSIKRSFTFQHDASDCGVACLASIVKFHGGEVSLDYLRKISGTTHQGTTLLGLAQASKQIGLNAIGLKANSLTDLRELTEPAILHVVTVEQLQHYLVYYPEGKNTNQGIFKIGDPAKGILNYTEKELDAKWASKALLFIKPTSKFNTSNPVEKKRMWLAEIIKTDFTVLLSSIFLGLMISIFSVSTAILSQRLLDVILPERDTTKLIIILIIFALIMFSRITLNFIRSIILINQAKDFNNRIIKNYFGNLLKLPKLFFDTRKIGELIARMNDSRRIQTTLSLIVGNLIIDILTIISSLSLIFYYSLQTGLLVLISLPLLNYIAFYYASPIRKLQHDTMSSYALVESQYIDTLQGINDIKLFNKNSAFEQINISVYSMFQDRVAKLGRLSTGFSSVAETISTIFVVLIFGLTAKLVIDGKLHIGEMVAIVSLSSSYFPIINRLVNSYMQVQEARIAFDRMFEFLLLDKERSGQENNFSCEEILIQDLSFGFPGSKPILKKINLKIERGKPIAIIGPSGSGKSTLVQLLQNFYQPESGKILVSGKDLTNIDLKTWRNSIGCVSHNPKIFNGSLLYNLSMSNSHKDVIKAKSFCETSNLTKYFESLPNGYDSIVGEEGINLSGGQRQIIGISRALLNSPKIFLLDEATSSLDAHAEEFMLNLILKRKSDLIVIMITHRSETVRYFDKVYQLSNGQLTPWLKDDGFCGVA